MESPVQSTIVSKLPLSQGFLQSTTRALLIKRGGGRASLPTFVSLSSNTNSGMWRIVIIELGDSRVVDLYQRCRNKDLHPSCICGFESTTAGSLGLMFLTRFCSIHSDFSLMVYNPFTEKVRHLQMPLHLCTRCTSIPSQYGGFSLAGVIENTQKQQYKLLFNTFDSLDLQTFRLYCVYDSQTGDCNLKYGPNTPFIHISSRVVCNGCLYFLHVSVLRDAEGVIRMSRTLFEPQLGIYESETDSWRGVEQSLMPKLGRARSFFPQLVQHKGILYYVAVSDAQRLQGEPVPLPTWCFFKLDEKARSSSTLWTKVREMPQHVFWQLSVRINARNIYDDKAEDRCDVCCEGQGDDIYFYSVKPSFKAATSQAAPTVSTERRTGTVLLHNFEENSWTFLNDYPEAPSSDDRHSKKRKRFSQNSNVLKAL
ncbi:hypothetical protein AXG93_4010s1060 [Marchantia polymorpha subsp. ruderalis]|uniref:F-box associated domain-containing protein n=1 Tax=Marchantia polymorpha subsp. ruderalis TaxID=1480154 RepID=A0A176VH65_MARPO|nr:hypothetical protein AXG93_4010s1060 [Marchantia polymorpha subsp. ruderalis]